MSHTENILVCVRTSFLSRALALPLPQLASFLARNSEGRQPCDDPYVWLARDVTITGVQTSLPHLLSRWRGVQLAAAAAKSVALLWLQKWRLLWEKAGMKPQLHGIVGRASPSAERLAALTFEGRFSDWAHDSCRVLWQPATAYGACLAMVEEALESVCHLMEAPMLQKNVYSRIGGERLLHVVCPHRRHLKVLQLWMQV
jgi:hypothetical protein